MKERRGKKSISGIAALLLLAVFAAGILSVLLAGAGVYRRVSEQSAGSYDLRTCAQYLAGKVRQAPGAVTCTAFGDGESLLIREEIGGEAYWTRIYCHDGWLMELFTAADAALAPEAGEKILPIRRLEVSDAGGSLRFSVTDGEGEAVSFLLTIRGGESYEE